jgi:hypothetical protein
VVLERQTQTVLLMNLEINIITQFMNLNKFNIALSKSKDLANFLSKDVDFLAYLDSINQTFTGFFNLSFYNLTNDKSYWEKIYNELNNRYIKYDGNLFPIFTTGISDDIICLLNNKFVIIHDFASPGWELISSEIDINNIKDICSLYKNRNGISLSN